jgi:hypothetical protein
VWRRRYRCDVSPSLLFDYPRYRHAVRALAEPNDCEHDQQLKFTEIVWFEHFFDHNEEMLTRSSRRLANSGPSPVHRLAEVPATTTQLVVIRRNSQRVVYRSRCG